MSKVEAKYQEKFEMITKLKYEEQGKYYLNAFWKDFGEGVAEEVWGYAHRMAELNKEKGKEGDSIDELEAHKFLEGYGETLTVIELREKLRSIDINNDKRMALVEYLLFKFPQGTMTTLCESIQNENDPELLEAQRMVAEAQDAFQTATDNAEAARVAKADADAKETQSKSLAADAAAAAEVAKKDFEDSDAKRVDAEKKEADAAAVEDELKQALDNLKKQEADHATKIGELEKVAGQPGVKGGQAAAELLKLKNEDPLPLRKAQAEQKVVLKKAEKVRKVAADAAAVAKAAADAAAASAAAAKTAADESEAAAAEATAAAAAAAVAQEEAEQSAAKAEEALQSAQENVAKIKAKTSSRGSIWWMEREMTEMAKFAKPSKKKQ